MGTSGFRIELSAREQVIEHAIRVRMTPREATAVNLGEQSAPLPPVKDLDKWLWVDNCVREVLPASAHYPRPSPVLT